MIFVSDFLLPVWWLRFSNRIYLFGKLITPIIKQYVFNCYF